MDMAVSVDDIAMPLRKGNSRHGNSFSEGTILMAGSTGGIADPHANSG
jgi:hypothetical protein